MATSDGSLAPRSVEDALQVVRERVREHVADGSDGDGLRAHVRVLCEVARHDNVPPERLIVELKNALHGLPGLDGLSPAKRDAMRSKVVQYAIQEYFTDAD